MLSKETQSINPTHVKHGTWASKVGPKSPGDYSEPSGHPGTRKLLKPQLEAIIFVVYNIIVLLSVPIGAATVRGDYMFFIVVFHIIVLFLSLFFLFLPTGDVDVLVLLFALMLWVVIFVVVVAAAALDKYIRYKHTRYGVKYGF